MGIRYRMTVRAVAHVAKVVREMTEAPRTFPPVPPRFHAGQV